MIEKANSWQGRKNKDLDQDAIKHQAILEPQFTRGIEKRGTLPHRRTKVEINDFKKKVEIEDGLHRPSNS